jgi:hypothetical protein
MCQRKDPDATAAFQRADDRHGDGDEQHAGSDVDPEVISGEHQGEAHPRRLGIAA